MKISKKQLKKIIKERMKKFSPDDFKDVYNTARMAHVGQTRRDGSEYFSHPSEVRNIARKFYPGDNVVQMAALLHDSLEDAPGSTVSSVEEMEDFIKGSIQDQSSAREVIRVVRALTHEKGGSYTDYVLGLLGDVPTLRVKLADMVHNLSDSPRPKQKAKYREALDAISSQTSGRAPSGISPQHWQELLDLTEGKEIRTTTSNLRKVIREALSTEVPELTGGRKSSFQVKKEKELAAKRNANPPRSVQADYDIANKEDTFPAPKEMPEFIPRSVGTKQAARMIRGEFNKVLSKMPGFQTFIWCQCYVMFC